LGPNAQLDQLVEDGLVLDPGDLRECFAGGRFLAELAELLHGALVLLPEELILERADLVAEDLRIIGHVVLLMSGLEMLGTSYPRPERPPRLNLAASTPSNRWRRRRAGPGRRRRPSCPRTGDREPGTAASAGRLGSDTSPSSASGDRCRSRRGSRSRFVRPDPSPCRPRPDGRRHPAGTAWRCPDQRQCRPGTSPSPGWGVPAS